MKLKTTSKDSKNAHSSQPFFSKDNEGSFLSESKETQSTFFSPPAVQTKPNTDQIKDNKEDETGAIADEIVQRTDSSKTIMRSIEYGADPQFSQIQAIPLVKKNIQASPSEQLLFTILFSDQDKQRTIGDTGSNWSPILGKGPYAVKFQVSGGAEFNAPGSGKKMYTNTNLLTLPGRPLPRIMSHNTKLFIEKSWDRKSTITVTATISDLAAPTAAPDKGSTKDADHTITWTIVGRKHPCPTKLIRVGGFSGSKWMKTAYAKYDYQASSDPPPKTRPFYENQTVLETFGAISALDFTMDDLEDSWKKANPSLKTPDLAARKIFAAAAANATFVLNAKDEMYDQHGFRASLQTLQPFKESALTKGVGYSLPQSYLCDGKVIGTAKIQWMLKGSKLGSGAAVYHKKMGP